MTDLTAVVVTYNRKKLLQECLKALERQTCAIGRIIIVDNCSTDGTGEWLREQHSHNYHILFLPENIGGAGGFKSGIEEACKYPCEQVLILDDDCILRENYVECLLEAREQGLLKTEEQIAALCGTVYENGEPALNHRGYLVRHRSGPVFDYWKEWNELSYSEEYLDCDIASFCGLMISRTAIDAVGFPKEEYFIKCDDIEYSLRLRKAGHIVNVNRAILDHKTKETNNRTVDGKYFYDVRNSIDLTKRNRMYACAVKIVLKSLFITLMNRKSINSWIEAVADGMKGKLGKK